jgi:hypothetical protein
MDSLEQPTLWKIDMRVGAWNVRILYRAGSLKTVASKLANYNSDLVAVPEVRSIEDDGQPADDYTFFYGNGNANHLGKCFSYIRDS